MFPTIISYFNEAWMSEPLGLHPYGLLIATGFLVSMILATQRAPAEGESPETVNDLLFPLLLAGLFGARFIFILVTWEVYADNPISVFNPFKGGLVFYGGPIFAALYLIWWTQRQGKSFFKFADLLIPFVALSHALGRIGCLSAGCCHGSPTSSFLGIQYPAKFITPLEFGNLSAPVTTPPFAQMVRDGVSQLGDAFTPPLHPTQLYEAGFELMMFGLLIYLRDRKRFHGQLFLIWLSVYPVFRSFNELLRGDKGRGYDILGTGLSTSQLISIAVALTALTLFVVLMRRQKQSGVKASLDLASTT